MLHVTVTAAHKAEADERIGPLCCTCPVARAINDLLPEGYEASVAYAEIWIVRPGDDHDFSGDIVVAKIPTPDEAGRIIGLYDNGDLREEDLPMSFDLDYTPPEV